VGHVSGDMAKESGNKLPKVAGPSNRGVQP